MSRLVCNIVFVLFVFLGGSAGALEKPRGCGQSGAMGCLLYSSEVRLLRNLSKQGFDNYAFTLGLSHRTVAGAMHHGMKEVGVWIQTLAPHGRTPIYRHDCEEDVITVKGYGTFYLSDGLDPDIPGKPQEFLIYPNATSTMPVDSMHQMWNTNGEENLQINIIISRPPMQL